MLVSKNMRGISFNKRTARLVFEENGTKRAILVEGFRLDPTRSVHDIAVFDLETGGEISYIDAEGFFKDPDKVGLIGFTGGEPLRAYPPREKAFRPEENHLCKVNVLNKQIVWDASSGGQIKKASSPAFRRQKAGRQST